MTETNKIIVAIDGHSSCGKSTLAKQLADHYNFLYVDTGAMYRCITLLIQENNIALAESTAIDELLLNNKIYFKKIENLQHTYINGRDVTEIIRSPKVSDWVSEVAAVSAIRKKMVDQQRIYATENDIIMDGRDIGTVVFPEAKLKIFLTADPKIRAQRRHKELKDKGIKISLEEVAQNLSKRDHIDSTREDSPLRQAEDAIVVDNSSLNLEEQFTIVKGLIEKVYQ